MSRRRIGGHAENGRRAAHVDVAEPHFFQLPLLGGTAYVRLRTLDAFEPVAKLSYPCDTCLVYMLAEPPSHHFQIISALADVYSAGYGRLREQLVGKANEVALSGLDRSFSRPDPSELTAIASRRGALAGLDLDFTTPPRTEILSLHPTTNGMSISGTWVASAVPGAACGGDAELRGRCARAGTNAAENGHLQGLARRVPRRRLRAADGCPASTVRTVGAGRRRVLAEMASGGVFGLLPGVAGPGVSWGG